MSNSIKVDHDIPDKSYTINNINVQWLPSRHSKRYWYDNQDPVIRNYITGKDNPAFSGVGLRGLDHAKKEYMSLGNTFRRKSLSAPQMAKYENKYHIDQSLFDVARDEIESEYNADVEKYQSGKMSDRRWNRKSQRYEQQMRNLDENQYILDQQQNPLKYVRPHQRGDTAPLLFSLGLPLSIIGGIKTAPYIWKFLNHPITQTVGTIDGIRNLFTGNGVQKTYNHFKNREYSKGTLSLTGDILDASPLLGATKAGITATKAVLNGENFGKVANNLWKYTDIGRWLSSENRAKHAYATIVPFSYGYPIKRGSKFIFSWLRDKPIDINNIKWMGNDSGFFAAADDFQVAARDDAWRIYNGLNPKYNFYTKNPNGTYSYNFETLSKYIPEDELVIPLKEMFNTDYWTTNHGHLWNTSKDIHLNDVENFSNYIQHVEDMWDVNPFEHIKLPTWIPFNKKINKLINNFEIGQVTGGKPFKLEMDIPYHIDNTKSFGDKDRTHLGFYNNE